MLEKSMVFAEVVMVLQRYFQRILRFQIWQAYFASGGTINKPENQDQRVSGGGLF
ncbi:MAG: hypothetical protein ABFS03_13670 [Chloroflexota bacterium]